VAGGTLSGSSDGGTRRGTALPGTARLFRSAAWLTPLLLAACGGGGGVNGTPAPPTSTIPDPLPSPAPTPTPTPTPAPAPAPTPAPSADTAEYRATVGAVSMNALAAYSRGATGAGITVGVVDSGIDLQSEEFTGRLSAASAPVAGNASIDDEDGHGTAVAFTLAGRRNGAATHGVAYDATLLVARADTPGSCAAPASGGESSCSFDDNNIARGVDIARTAGARVVNISLGGDDLAPPDLLAAIGRATAAGIVVVISAGNDGRAQPSNSAAFANDAGVSRGLVIVAGSVGASDAVSSFSNRAGDSAAHYLAAVGERVRAPDSAGTPLLWSGTSFSAPQIAGAVALLAQAFPNLSGAQIVDVLIRSARDVGTPGVDATYGHGVLDLTRAFQPIGSASVAGTTGAASLTANAALSAPMGDARGGTLGAVILDGYGRAFAIDLARTIARYRPLPSLVGALDGRAQSLALAAGGMSVAVTLAPDARRRWGVAALALAPADASAARMVAASVVGRLGARASFGFATRGDAAGLTAQLAGERRPAFLVAQGDGPGFDRAPRAAAALRQIIGPIGLTAAVESGDVLAHRDPLLAGLTGWRRAGYDRADMVADARTGGLWGSLGVTRLGERDTVLGAQFDPSLGALHATSWFAEARARLDLAGGWTVGGAARRGSTRAEGGLGATGRIATGSFALDLGKAGLFGTDNAGLRLAQPLRVARGGIDLMLPTLWDYAARRVAVWTAQRYDLTPQGRELDAEARYGRMFAGGWIEGNLFWRRDPGNVAALPDDTGLALRFTRGF
jgi:subtilisin family serine protease